MEYLPWGQFIMMTGILTPIIFTVMFVVAVFAQVAWESHCKKKEQAKLRRRRVMQARYVIKHTINTEAREAIVSIYEPQWLWETACYIR